MIAVRRYQPSDLWQAVDVINTAADADRIRRLLPAHLQRMVMPDGVSTGSNSTPAAVATVDQDRVAGFIWWETDSPAARRFEGWVHPAWRRKGVGTALLTAVESFARERRQIPVTLYGRTYSDVPGAEVLFRRREYAEVRRFYMMSTPLLGRQFAADVPPGITLRMFRPDDLAALVEADNEIFAQHWGSHARTVAQWKRAMMETRPHDPALWVLAWDGDRIVGECLCHLSREGSPQDAWVSIVGVRREWRGRGLGQAVLAQGLRTLQRAGFHTAGLHVDTENTSAIRLYQRMGLTVARTRLHFAKTVGADS